MNGFIVNHGGSGNHGCEALLRMTLQECFPFGRTITYSDAPEEDSYYGIGNISEIQSSKSPQIHAKDFFVAYLRLKLKHDYYDLDLLPYKSGIKSYPSDSVAVSIGGDNYCYDNYPLYIRIHELIKKRNNKTILSGCSLEKNFCGNDLLIRDIASYDLISARESITYDMLAKAGIDNVLLAPDLAFLLPVQKWTLPEIFSESKVIGMNLSPLIQRKEKRNGILLQNYRAAVDYILRDTDYSVALIPHVVWKDNDDRSILTQLYEGYRDSDRVCLINDQNCMQLKWVISNCELFVGARTHAAIAAYSSLVPTLAIGYSVKAQGIAADLFGESDRFVLPIEAVDSNDTLLDSMRRLIDNKESIKSRLVKVMPGYLDAARQGGKVIKEYIDHE